MMKKKVALIIGTRPEAIKLAPVYKRLRKESEKFITRVIVTGQHRRMCDQVLRFFNIKADIDLDIMEPEQSLSVLTGRLVARLGTELARERPDVVLVQGSTVSAFAGALAAFYNRVPVGHIEAGLRSFDRFSPFPEEILRRLTGVTADWHFAPTESARRNLIAEGVPDENIYITGNTIIDALQAVMEKIGDRLPAGFDSLDLTGKKLILATAHRRENWERPLGEICRALLAVKAKHPEAEIIFSVHLNPKIRHVVQGILGDLPGFRLTEPLDYLPFVQLMNKAHIILTDSGGVQEEAAWLGKPVLVLRTATDRPEGVEAGTVRLVGTDSESICSHVFALLDDPLEHRLMAHAVNPYGDGRAAERIAAVLAPKSVFP